MQWAHFKREVYHKVGDAIFSSLVHRSHFGDTMRCGDDTVRVLYPGVLIESLDHEEATILACVRAANANYPCIKCLVPKSELHNIDGHFARRTVAAMQDVLERASNAKTETEREKILKDVGLHAVHVSFCSSEALVFLTSSPFNRTSCISYALRTLMLHIATICCTQMMWGNGASTCGYCY